MKTVENKNKILVVAAHPDDEVLGAGATIAKHLDHDDEVSVLILGDGATSRGPKANVKERAAQARAAALILGFKKLFLERLPDNKFDSVPLLDIVKIIEKVIYQIEPDTIYTHYPYDLNIDHRLTFEAVLTACRPQPGFFVKKILSFETPSSSEWQLKDKVKAFHPTEYVNVENFMNKKIEALMAYQNELREAPHPRSVEGIKILASFRGMEVGHKYAEAFQIIRSIKC